MTGLSSAYEFLRRTEHILQMENGVQTHTVTDELEKRALLGRRMTFAGGGDFENDLALHTQFVGRVFARVFGESDAVIKDEITEVPNVQERILSHIMASIEKSELKFNASDNNVAVLERLTFVSPHFSAMLAANPSLIAKLPDPASEFIEPDYADEMMLAVESERDFGARLSVMRRTWAKFLLEIVVRDVFEKISIREAKRLQTKLGEASIAAAIRIVRDELAAKYGSKIKHLDLVIFALGKLGGRGLDYGSDLDIVVVYFDPKDPDAAMTPSEFYSRAVELFATTLSSMTRDGNLYRVDLRLRPFGSKGMSAISIDAFLDYMRETAAVWEMLAFVKLRTVGGDLSLGYAIESETRRIIHERAAATDVIELASETRRVRLALEEQRVRPRRVSEIDIKYGSGGMLDIYFAMRFLQLRDNVPDDMDDRSTPFMLAQLKDNGSLAEDVYAELLAGYEFLATLDHNLRLTVGRTTRIPLANNNALNTIASRMRLDSPKTLLEQLTLHRLAIRSAFESIVVN